MISDAESVVLPLRVKGSKPFGIFAHLNGDNGGETLRRTWRVASKVANELEYGHRLENLSWRMWHLQEVIGSTSFKARTDASIDSIGITLAHQLESDKKLSLTELQTPAFRWTDKNDAIRHLGIMRIQQREASNKRVAITSSTSISLKTDANLSDRQSRKSAIPVRRSKRHEEPISKDEAITAKSSRSRTDLADIEATPPNARNSPTNVSSEEAIPIALSDSKAGHSDDSTSGTSSIISGQSSKYSKEKSVHRLAKRVKRDTSRGDRSGRQSSSPPVCWQLTEAAARQRKRLLAKDTAIEKDTGEIVKDTTRGADDTRKRMERAAGVPSAAPLADTASKPSPAKPSMWTLEEVEMAERELLEQGVDFTGPFAAMLADLKQGLLTRVRVEPTSEDYSGDMITSSSTNVERHQIPHHLAAHMTDPRPRNQIQANQYNTYGSPSSIHTMPTNTSGGTATQELAHVFSLPASPSVVSFQHNATYGNWGNVTRQHSYHAPQSGPTRHDHRRNNSIQVPYSINSTSSSGSANGKESIEIKAENQDENQEEGEAKSRVRRAQCANCGATSTPLWRRDVNFDLQCNACGLYYKLHQAPRPISLKHRRGQSQRVRDKTSTNDDGKKKMRVAASPASRRSSSSSGSANCEWLGIHAGAACANCGTTKTPLWRKDAEQRVICNACGLYSKMHKADRPADMRADKIRRRSRHDDRQKRALEQVEHVTAQGNEMVQQMNTSMGHNMPLQPLISHINSAGSMQVTTASTSAIQIPAEFWDNQLCPMGAWGENCCQNLPPPEDASQEQLMQQQAILQQLGMSTFHDTSQDMPLVSSPNSHTMGSLDAATMASILGDDWLVDYPSAPANTPGTLDASGETTKMTSPIVSSGVVGPSYQIKRRKVDSAISPNEWWTVPATTASNDGSTSAGQEQQSHQ